MPIKVVLKFTKGGLTGQEFCYDQKECVIIGRLNDSNIVIPAADKTVSRYHCIMDITPPVVTVRDFGSLNGTYLNGEKIGQGDSTKSVEERREQKSEEFSLKAGDRLGLGLDCELVLDVAIPQYCADCFCEMEHSEYTNAERQPVCSDCHAKAEEQRKKEEAARIAKEKAEREAREAEERAKKLAKLAEAAKEKKEKEEAERKHREAEKIAAELREKERLEKERRQHDEAIRQAEAIRIAAEKEKRNHPKCELCGVAVSAGGAAICSTCRQDPLKALQFVLLQAKKGVDGAHQIAGYKNIKMLGKGGMGAVWLVEEEKTGKQMALKLMLPDAASNEKAKNMFLREAYTACQLMHPNIVQHYKCGRSGDVFFVLLELCQGGSVDDLMRKNGGKLSMDTATHIILQTLDGLEYAHHAPLMVQLGDGSTKAAKGIVHRDLKPGNIFLMDNSSRPVAKVADFGLAKAFQTAGLTEHTVTGQAAGTPSFMPRQQITNYRYAKPDVDVWAAAASYYNMLTGFVPKNFAGKKDAFAVALYEDAIPILIRNPKIPRKIAEVIDTALREKPKIGFETALNLKKAIEAAL